MFPNDEEKIAQAALKSFEVANHGQGTEIGRCDDCVQEQIIILIDLYPSS